MLGSCACGLGGLSALGLLCEELELTLLGYVSSVTESLKRLLSRLVLLLGDNATSICLH